MAAPLPVAVVRYYRPGVNWVGRVLFLVPVLGVALVAMSGGQWGYSDGWVTIGLGVWVVVALVAEGVLWPAERRLQEVVATRDAAGRDGDRTGRRTGGDGRCTRPPVDPAGAVPADRACWGSAWPCVLVAVAVLMVAKP